MKAVNGTICSREVSRCAKLSAKFEYHLQCTLAGARKSCVHDALFRSVRHSAISSTRRLTREEPGATFGECVSRRKKLPAGGETCADDLACVAEPEAKIYRH